MVFEKSKSKKQKKEECIINCLPGDAIEQIFLKLPVSTLLTCTGVCKKWYDYIRDPLFAAAHLKHAPRCALLFFPQESIAKKLYPSDAIIFDETWSQSTCTVPVIGPNDFLCGTCNGLVCLYTKTSTIKIANLATGDYLHLEKPAKNLKGDHFSYYTFGFDPVTEEYKVTHFLNDHGNSSRQTFSVIQVYTFGSENWKDVHAPEALGLGDVKRSGVVNVSGAVYWLTEGNGSNSEIAVMSFDLSKETFTLIQVPEAAIGDSSHRCYWITEIDGKACIATAEVYRNVPRMLSGELQIWTLDNNNVEKRWSHKYSIQHAPNFLPGPHFFHGDKIIMQSRNCNLYSYELLGKNLEVTKKLSSRVGLLDFSPYKPQNMQSFICVKSLVRLDAYEKVSIMHRPKRRDGWELKKWEVWERELSSTKDLFSTIHKTELVISELAHLVAMKINRMQHQLPDEMQCWCAEIIQKLQHGPHTPLQPMSSRRLNWVEHKRTLEQLPIRVENLRHKTKAIAQAREKIFSLLDTCMLDQCASGSNADISAQ
ncbi:unnamed protein product [Urochloa decumbens]|uniref:F-box domain-containing protein n=1 Tax=Urochloa decumbens TaxID=240449 RepID=A0ABC9G7P9_9POAL